MRHLPPRITGPSAREDTRLHDSTDECTIMLQAGLRAAGERTAYAFAVIVPVTVVT